MGKYLNQYGMSIHVYQFTIGYNVDTCPIMSLDNFQSTSNNQLSIVLYIFMMVLLYEYFFNKYFALKIVTKCPPKQL